MHAIDVLVFDGCPNVDATLARVAAALRASGKEDATTVQVVRVQTEEDAVRERFLGSPSVRVDGVDVEPEARTRNDFGLQCRVYSVGARVEGAPAAEWIAAALGTRSPSTSEREAAPTVATPPRDCCGRG